MYLRPHWRQKGEELGHVIVVQKGGQGCVDLLGDNLTKSLETVKEFSQVPENYNPKDVFYAFNFSYILNSDGRVYSRKNFSETAFYSGYFSSYPVSYDENGEFKELNVDRFIQGLNYRQSDGGFVLAYEKVNKRFLALRDMEGYWGPDRSGEIVKIESNDYPEDFIPLHNTGDNELFFSYGFAGSSYGTQGLYNIYRTPQGKYIEQQFDLSLNVGGTTSISINSRAQRDFPDGYLDENSIVDVPDGGGSSGYGSSYVFISKGNKLYCYSRVNDDKIVLSE